MWRTVHQGYYELPDPYLSQYPYQYQYQYYPGYLMGPGQYNDPIMDNAIYGSDEFRMYAYKVKRCPRMRSHDWTECPYAHRGEKAQRRDPRQYLYAAIACPAYRNGRCHKGDLCDLSHGVFEYWLHPDRYRTRACNGTPHCMRRVCFFAHTPDELRPEPEFYPRKFYVPHPYDQYPRRPYRPHNCAYRAVPVGRGMYGGGHRGSRSATVEEYEMILKNKKIMDESFEKVESFLNSLRSLTLSDEPFEFEDEIEAMDNYEMVEAAPSVSELPEFDWVTELLQ
ncbi:hypothetical protein CerSpe_093690 [Prunus speciosa]